MLGSNGRHAWLAGLNKSYYDQFVSRRGTTKSHLHLTITGATSTFSFAEPNLDALQFHELVRVCEGDPLPGIDKPPPLSNANVKERKMRHGKRRKLEDMLG